MVVEALSTFLRYRWLLYELVIRDLKTKYRRSILGYFWSLLNPLLMMVILTIVFSTLFRFDIPNYPVYLISGQIIYNFFNEATSMSMTSILRNSSLIKKVYIPKYIFPIAIVLSSFVTLLFSLIAIAMVMLITKVVITPAILFLPIPLLYIFFFSVGVGMTLSVLAVYFRDIVHLYGVLLTAWMYLTPIFYPLSMVPDYVKKIIYLNPLYYFIEIFRKVVLYGQIPSMELNLICILYVTISLSAGIIIFYKNQKDFILYI